MARLRTFIAALLLALSVAPAWAADTKIKDLTDGGRCQFDDETVINRASGPNVDRKVNCESIAGYVNTTHINRRFSLYNDFAAPDSANGASIGGELDVTFNGTGTQVIGSTTLVDAAHPGVAQLETGTTATGRAAITTELAAFRLGGGAWVYEALVRIEDLSDVTEEYDFRIGFGDTNTGDQTDGVYFEYDRENNTDWNVVTANNSTRTRSDSNVAVAADAWVRLRIEINAAGNSASFFVNGTETAGSPIATNIPTGAGRDLGLGMWVVKSAGTTERVVYSDYLYAENDLTTAR